MKHRIALFVAVALVAVGCGSGDEVAETTTTLEATSTTTTTAPGTTTTTTAATTTTTEPPPPPFDTWTAVLASLPTDEATRDDAIARLALLSVDDGGVLLSDDYPSLNPGYWVVYSGVFAGEPDAKVRCFQLDRAGIDCYHRYLGPSTTTAPVFGNGQYVAWIESDNGTDLAAVSFETGTIVRTISDAWASGGIYPGTPRITADGAEAYFDIGYEDSWFSCDATLGGFGKIDLRTGAWDIAGAGIDPVPSPDGRYLAYVAAERCLPDPEQPDYWFIAYHGTVVVRDLRDGSERRWKPSKGTVDTPGSFVWGMGWNAIGTELYLSLDADKRIRVLELNTPTTVSTDALPILPLEVQPGYWIAPVGRLAGGDLVVRWADGPEDAVVVHIARFDPASGQMRGEEYRGSGWPGVSLDSTHAAVLIWEGTSISSPDVAVTPSGSYVVGADW